MLPNWNNAKNISKNPKPKNPATKKGKKTGDSKPRLLQLCHSLSCSQQIQLLLLLSCVFLLVQILICCSSLGLLEDSPHILLSAEPLQGEPEMAVCSVEELQYLRDLKNILNK